MLVLLVVVLLVVLLAVLLVAVDEVRGVRATLCQCRSKCRSYRIPCLFQARESSVVGSVSLSHRWACARHWPSGALFAAVVVAVAAALVFVVVVVVL